MVIPNSENDIQIGMINDHHDFLRDNDFIHTGYRLYFNSTKKILKISIRPTGFLIMNMFTVSFSMMLITWGRLLFYPN